MRTAGNAPADIMQKCGSVQYAPLLFPKSVNPGEIVKESYRKIRNTPRMRIIIGERLCNLPYKLNIPLFQITTRSFSLQ